MLSTGSVSLRLTAWCTILYMIDVRGWTPDSWRDRVAEATRLGSKTWRALRRLSSTMYGGLVAETWRSLMFEDSVETVIAETDAVFGEVRDPDAVALLAGDDVVIVACDLEELGVGRDYGRSGQLGFDQKIIHSVEDAGEEVTSSTLAELPVETAAAIDDLRMTLRLRRGLDARFLGVGAASGKAYVGLTRDGGDSIYLLNEPVRLEPSAAVMDEFTVSKIDSCYHVDELRDLVLHSIASGDEIVLDADGDQADGSTRPEWWRATDCAWALDDVELGIALDVRMMRKALDMASKLDGDVEDSLGAQLRAGLFDSMLDAGLAWPMVSQAVGGCGMEPDYCVIGLGRFLTMDDVEAVSSELAGDGEDGLDDDDVEVEVVAPVSQEELDAVNRSNEAALLAVSDFCLATFSAVATSDEAAEWRIDPIAGKPESVYGVKLSDQIAVLKARLSATLDGTCSVEYLGRRVDDGRLVFARAGDDGKLLRWPDVE